MITRRGLFTGLFATGLVLTAPTIIRQSKSLMPIHVRRDREWILAKTTIFLPEKLSAETEQALGRDWKIERKLPRGMQVASRVYLTEPGRAMPLPSQITSSATLWQHDRQSTGWSKIDCLKDVVIDPRPYDRLRFFDGRRQLG